MMFPFGLFGTLTPTVHGGFYPPIARRQSKRRSKSTRAKAKRLSKAKGRA